MTPEIEALLLESLKQHQKKYKWFCYGDQTLENLVNSLAAEYVDLSESVEELQDELKKAADMAVLAYEFVNGTTTLETLTDSLDEHFNPVEDDSVAQYFNEMSAIVEAENHINNMDKPSIATIETDAETAAKVQEYIEKNPNTDIKVIKTDDDKPDILQFGTEKK